MQPQHQKEEKKRRETYEAMMNEQGDIVSKKQEQEKGMKTLRKSVQKKDFVFNPKAEVYVPEEIKQELQCQAELQNPTIDIRSCCNEHTQVVEPRVAAQERWEALERTNFPPGGSPQGLPPGPTLAPPGGTKTQRTQYEDVRLKWQGSKSKINIARLQEAKMKNKKKKAKEKKREH